ncbi:MAG: preprotein translocase subunit TatC [Stutzerimonas stutzeri]|nr:MAG: preprotein translocase subunit TatC [Stutzerimonas stutzeri]
MTRPPLIDEAALRPLIEHFYERVRADPLLGPVFGAAVHDWDDHHARLADFWSSVMLTTGRYKGNPVALHLIHADSMTADRFARWLALWRQTTDELLDPAAAAAMQAKAARIAESLQLAVQYRRPAAA